VHGPRRWYRSGTRRSAPNVGPLRPRDLAGQPASSSQVTRRIRAAAAAACCAAARTNSATPRVGGARCASGGARRSISLRLAPPPPYIGRQAPASRVCSSAARRRFSTNWLRHQLRTPSRRGTDRRSCRCCGYADVGPGSRARRGLPCDAGRHNRDVITVLTSGHRRDRAVGAGHTSSRHVEAVAPKLLGARPSMPPGG
jgi:hypothetical protein